MDEKEWKRLRAMLEQERQPQRGHGPSEATLAHIFAGTYFVCAERIPLNRTNLVRRVIDGAARAGFPGAELLKPRSMGAVLDTVLKAKDLVSRSSR